MGAQHHLLQASNYVLGGDFLLGLRLRRILVPSGSMVIVLDTLDVIFAQIASGLHLYQFQVDLAGILEAMVGADRHPLPL